MKKFIKFILGVMIMYPIGILGCGILMCGPWSGALLMMEFVNFLIGNDLILNSNNIDGITALAPGFYFGIFFGIIGGGIIIEQEWEQLF